MKGTALVTGANGHIGSHVVRALLAEGRQVRAMVRRTSDLRSLEGLAIEIVRGDVTRADDVGAAMAGCRSVFHTAAVYSTDPARAEEIMQTSLAGTRCIFEAAAKASVERLVYTSSVAAIGHNYDPAHVLNESSWNDAPMDAYCAAKTDSERLAWKLADELGVPTVAVNPATVLGPGDWKPTPSNWFVLQYLQSPRPVYYDGGHCYVDVEDVARGHLLAEARGIPGERYVLGGENVPIREVFESLSAMTGLARPRVRLGRSAMVAAAGVMELQAKAMGRRPLVTREKVRKIVGYHSYFSSERAERVLGYEARAVGDVLARSVAWFAGDRGFLTTSRRKQIHAVMSRVHAELA